MRTIGPGTPLLVCVSLLLATASCASVHSAADGEMPQDGRLITAEMIARSDAVSAWDVLRRTGAFIMSRDDAGGRPISLRTRRGRSSIVLQDADIPEVTIDGVLISDLRRLRDIPASTIEFIQLLNGVEGTTLFGTNAGAGVIIIVSKTGG